MFQLDAPFSIPYFPVPPAHGGGGGLSEVLAPAPPPHAVLACCVVVGLHLSWGMEKKCAMATIKRQ